jgi:hypothetical protein
MSLPKPKFWNTCRGVMGPFRTADFFSKSADKKNGRMKRKRYEKRGNQLQSESINVCHWP